MAWFRKEKYTPIKPQRRKEIPDGLWIKCVGCQEILYRPALDENYKVCPRCGFHFRVSVQERLEQMADRDTFVECDAHMESKDPLHFVDSKDYLARLKEDQQKTSLKEAVVTGHCKIDGHDCIVCALDFAFRGASMGSVVGEKITRSIESATELKLPLITISCSGGARMQEGVLSLMQMVKTSASLARFSDAGLLHISILTHPTTGGVTASFASLGDVLIAEPNALIGFAGDRVIEQTIGEKLPEGFRRSESLLEHGLIDMVVERPKLKATVSRLIALLTK